MSVLRPLLLVTAILAGATSLPAQARLEVPVELTATTVISATQSGFVDVAVPLDARLSPKVQGNPDVTIAGDGRFVGVWLQREDGSSADGLTSLRLPSFLGGGQRTTGSVTPDGGCAPMPSATVPLTYDCTQLPAPSAILLHEGLYRLTVLTDGSPLTITLTLHGLDAGTTSLSPTTTLDSTEEPLPAREAVADRMVTFGDTAPLHGDLATWVLATATGSTDPVFNETSTCERADNAAAPPFGYAPACPQGRSGSYSYQLRLGPETVGGIGGFATSDTDNGAPVGLGGSFGDSGGVTLGSTLGVWLQLS